MKKLFLPAAIAALSCFMSQASQAAVIVVAPTNVLPGSLIIDQDITLTVTTAGTARILVFDEWVAASDGSNTVSVSTLSTTYSQNGGPDTAAGVNSFVRDGSINFGAITLNDGYIVFGAGVTVALTDTITIRAGTYILPAVANFNPLTTQTFTGNVFLASQTGVRLTSDVSLIPEPSSTLSIGLASILLLTLRKRRTL